MSEQPVPPSSDIAQRDSHQLRRGTLGVVGVAFFVVSAAAPLTAMAGGAPWRCCWATAPASRPRTSWSA